MLLSITAPNGRARLLLNTSVWVLVAATVGTLIAKHLSQGRPTHT